MTLTKNGAAAVVVSMTAVLPGVAVRDATSARGKEAAVTSAPGNVRAGLERLFDAEMAYRPGMAEVVSGEDREGVLIGSGDGVVKGDKIHGRIRWSFYSADCLYPAVRAGAPVPANLHVCKVNPGGVIDTDDGAEISFEAKGFGLRGYDGAERNRYVLTLSLPSAPQTRGTHG